MCSLKRLLVFVVLLGHQKPYVEYIGLVPRSILPVYTRCVAFDMNSVSSLHVHVWLQGIYGTHSSIPCTPATRVHDL